MFSGMLAWILEKFHNINSGGSRLIINLRSHYIGFAYLNRQSVSSPGRGCTYKVILLPSWAHGFRLMALALRGGYDSVNLALTSPLGRVAPQELFQYFRGQLKRIGLCRIPSCTRVRRTSPINSDNDVCAVYVYNNHCMVRWAVVRFASSNHQESTHQFNLAIDAQLRL